MIDSKGETDALIDEPFNWIQSVEERVSNVLSEPWGAGCTRHLGHSETQTSLMMPLSIGTRLTPVQTAMQTCLHGDKINSFRIMCTTVLQRVNENYDVK